jgi:DNA-binding winged helix-turn-helix (wHTH) protein
MGSETSNGSARFAGFELDLRTGELRKNGGRVRLQAQPLKALRVLLEHQGELVTREQLRREVWPQDTFVDFDHGLNKAVAKLRDAVDESDTSPSIIETLPRLGYRFIPRVFPPTYFLSRAAKVRRGPMENPARPSRWSLLGYRKRQVALGAESPC